MNEACGVTLEARPLPVTPQPDNATGLWHRSYRATAVTAVMWGTILAVAAWAVTRALGLERGMLPVQLTAFTPYVAAGALVPLALALVRRCWIAAAVATVATVTLAACVLPRAVATAGTPPADAVTLRVMTANLYEGNGSAATMVDLVRRYRIDVLAVQELTTEAEQRLSAAGLGALLPNRVTNPLIVAGGTGIFTRLTIQHGSARQLAASGFRQTLVTVEVPGKAPVRIESAHPCAPMNDHLFPTWTSDFAEQPRATPNGPVQILLGDFNATLDHMALRRLIASGYRDAAAAVGKGLTPTWPTDGRLIPGVTLDHVLADRRIGVRAVAVQDLPGSDHRVVTAELVLS